ncbi:hypothetical protein K439DRAFT_1625206 [Ramaria rubella]|nr:hypothetical protein K439DRAFT_1625206 [Ramaria rubella]
MALSGRTISRRAVASFKIVQSSSMSPVDGTMASHAREKQPSNPPSDSTMMPSQSTDTLDPSPHPPFPAPLTADQRLATLEKSVGVLLALMQQAQQIAQQQPQSCTNHSSLHNYIQCSRIFHNYCCQQQQPHITQPLQQPQQQQPPQQQLPQVPTQIQPALPYLAPQLNASAFVS